MPITQFKLGEKFPLPIHSLGDGGIFQYNVNGAMFILKLSRFDILAIDAFRTGRMKLGLFERNHILFFLYQIGGIFNSWGDCPFFVQTLPKNKWPLLKEGQEKMLHLYFVDSRTTLLVAIRRVCLRDEFWLHLNTVVKKQQRAPFDARNYAAAVEKIWRQLSSEQMAEQALVLQTAGISIASPAPSITII